ncbi:hypothetical protein V5O48_011016 [Marasmius crinis-equi]|uniref:FAD-binding PCMH-type domain-containing protein n=1 Tax=Marasmius crinis-equi TaxID=585013 RepID=A0ABR3F6T0_9AGAR
MGFSIAFISLSLSLAALTAADLRGDLSGAGIRALLPGDDGYVVASGANNRRFALSPAAIAYPNSAEDVSQIVIIGANIGLSVVARSGGHSYIANGLGGKDGALVVDLSNMTRISVDASSRFATIETGNRLGNVALGLNDQGMAMPHGLCPHVGIGGHSAFGGWGWTSRMWGLTLDVIKAANTVLPNGTTARVTADNHPDLFWAIRGAAPSFGITTSVEVETFAVPQHASIYSYSWDLTADAAAQAFVDYQSFVLDTTDLPPELGVSLTLTKSNTSGHVAFSLGGGWYGEPDKLDGVWKPLLDKLPDPASYERMGNGTWMDAVEFGARVTGSSLDTLRMPSPSDLFYSKSLMTSEGSPSTGEAALSLMRYLSNEGFRSNLNWIIQIELVGGSNSRINAAPLNSTSYVRRDALFTWHFRGVAPNNTASYPAEGYTFVDGAYNSVVGSMPSDWDYSAYVNYPDDRLQGWQERYYGGHYDRLKSIKRAIDPDNVFSFPTSIEVSE